MRLPILPWLLPLPLAALATAGASLAQPTSDPDMLDVTCADYLVAARTADPGPNPSRKRREQALAAQDSMADAMLWVHGYLTGRAPAGTAPSPLTRAWMVEYVGKLAKACTDNSPDGQMRLADAATTL